MAASDTRASMIKEFPCRIDEGFYLMGGEEGGYFQYAETSICT